MAASTGGTGSDVKGKSYLSSSPIAQYTLEHNAQEPALKRLREHSDGEMTSAVEVGNLLTLLAKALGARKVLDVGVYLGYSAFSMALGLPQDGRVVACDVHEEFIQQGRPFWVEGGVDSKIDVRIQPAVQTLQELIDNGESGTFDLMFIDADKSSYPTYFELGVKLLRSGGMIVVDNALWNGRVVDASDTSEDTQAIRRMNDLMHQDDRVTYVLLNVADGVGLALKK